MEEKNKKELIELVKSLQKEKQDLEKAYIELDLECRDLRTENEELKSPKFASWKLKFFNLKEEFDKELAEHEEFAKKAKAEIERLTEESDEMFDRHAKENQAASILIEKRNNEIAELKKQVDELKGQNEFLHITIRNNQPYQQGCKDTAQEILQMLYTAMQKTNIVVEIKKRYGVEV